MYTVIRFLGDTDCLPLIMKTGTAMNAIRAGVYAGLRRAGDGFACEVCAEADWMSHRSAILAFIGDFSDLIKQSVSDGASVTVDIAIEPEDIETHRPILVLHHDSLLISKLASCGAALEVSIY